MPRVISSAVLTALASQQLSIGFLVEFNFVSGPSYIWSGFGNLSWNSHTWVGVGALGSISTVSEASTVEAKGMTLTLSGIDATLLPDVLNEFAYGNTVTVYLAFFSGGAVITSPLIIFQGRQDQPVINISGATATISINCESKLMDMNVACNRTYTQEDQNRDWPGDLGMNFVSSIQEMTIYWGSAPTVSGNV
jgi:hypothetical protein